MIRLMSMILALLPALLPGAVAAKTYDRVTDRAAFVALVNGRTLTNLGVRLQVTPAGAITGRAFGRDVVGDWNWEGGYFCRTMAWGAREFARNCQAVGLADDTLRFTADQGKGDTADLRIR